jgi:hypothetical protein
MRFINFIFIGSTLLTGLFLLSISILLCFIFLQDAHHQIPFVSLVEDVIMQVGYKFTLALCLLGILFILQIQRLKQL